MMVEQENVWIRGARSAVYPRGTQATSNKEDRHFLVQPEGKGIILSISTSLLLDVPLVHLRRRSLN